MSPYLSPKNAIAPERLGLVLGGLEGADGCVGERLAVGQPFDLLDLLGGDARVVGEVEPQPVGTDPRAGLLDVLAEHLAQRPVQDVRAGVVLADRVAPIGVDRRRRGLSGRDRAGRDARRVATQSRQRERRVEHLGRAGLGGDGSGVADLAAALGVERSAVEEDLDRADCDWA